MAIAFNAISDSGAQTTQTYSFNHTVPTDTTDVVLLIGVMSVIRDPSVVTYGGTVLTFVGTSTRTNTRVNVYKLIQPPTGTNSCDVTLNLSSDDSIAYAISFTGADEPTNVEASNGANGSGLSSNPSVSVTTLTDNALVVDFVGHSSAGGDMTVGSGQTQRGQATFSSGFTVSRAAVSTEPKVTAGSVTMDWTLASAQGNWATFAVALKPADTRATIQGANTIQGVATITF